MGYYCFFVVQHSLKEIALPGTKFPFTIFKRYFVFILFQHKLYIQKLRAVYLFENNFSEDVENNIIRAIASYSTYNWKEILQDNFIIDNLLSKMDVQTITNIIDNFVKHLEKVERLEIPANILNSPVILNAVNAVVLKKINKIMSKQKRKHDEESVPKFLSSKIFSTLPDDFFYVENNKGDVMLKIKSLYTTENGMFSGNFDMKISEEKICRLLEISKAFPVVFSHGDAQKVFLTYLFSLHKDLTHDFSKGNFSKLQEQLEELLFGKFKHLLSIFINNFHFLLVFTLYTRSLQIYLTE